ADKGRRPKPGIERVPVDLRFDAGEDFVPEVHFSEQRTQPSTEFRQKFPQFFPQVWKTLARDQSCIGSMRPGLGRVGPEKDADCSTLVPPNHTASDSHPSKPSANMN